MNPWILDPSWLRRSLLPTADNTFDIGSTSLRIKDVRIAGDYYLANTKRLYSYQSDGVTAQQLILLDGTNNTTIDTPTGTVIKFSVAGSSKTRISASAFYPSTSGAITLGIASTNQWGDVYTAGDIVASKSVFSIKPSTTDGSDNTKIVIGIDQTRGGWAQFTGNEEAGGGRVDIQSGNASGANINILVRSTNGAVTFGSNSVETWQMNSSGQLVQNVTNGGDLILSKTGTVIRTATSDGSDNKYIGICGGGAYGASRGAGMLFCGNEEAGTGSAEMQLGNVTGGSFNIRLFATGTGVIIKDNSTTVISLYKTGQIEAVASHGGIAQSISSAVTTTGTTISDAVQLTSWYNYLSGGTGLMGAKLDGSMLLGQNMWVYNQTGFTQVVYPQDGSSKIIHQGTDLTNGVGLNVSAAKIVVFFKISSTVWHSVQLN